jgi:hypothetical protein
MVLNRQLHACFLLEHVSFSSDIGLHYLYMPNRKWKILKLSSTDLRQGDRETRSTAEQWSRAYYAHIIRQRAASLTQIDPPLRRLLSILEKKSLGARHDWL